MDSRTPTFWKKIDLSVAAVICLFQIGLPMLDIQGKFWLELSVWLLFLAASVQLVWISTPTRFRFWIAIALAALTVYFVRPSLKKYDEKEHALAPIIEWYRNLDERAIWFILGLLVALLGVGVTLALQRWRQRRARSEEVISTRDEAAALAPPTISDAKGVLATAAAPTTLLPSAVPLPSPIETTFFEEDDLLFLRVMNPGTSANFRVSLSFEKTIEIDRPKGLVYGVWNGAPSAEVDIRSGESRDLLVAERAPVETGDLIGPYYQWQFPYFDGTAKKLVSTRRHFLRNYMAAIWQDPWERMPDDPEMVVRFDILSDTSSARTKTVTFKGAAWNDPSIIQSASGSQEDIERIREAYPVVERAVGYACEYVVAHLLMPSHSNQAQALLVGLLGSCIATPCRAAREAFEFGLAIPSPTGTLVISLERLLGHYGVLIDYIERVALVVLGKHQFYWSEGYAGLHQRHSACVGELRRLSRRSALTSLHTTGAELSQRLTKPPITEEEAVRRRSILSRLYEQFGALEEKTPRESMTEVPSADWTNAQLAQLGESWRL